MHDRGDGQHDVLGPLVSGASASDSARVSVGCGDGVRQSLPHPVVTCVVIVAVTAV